MARQRKPEHENQEEAVTRRRLETVANAATRSEKVAWERKMDNMQSMINTLKPLEDQILEIMVKKNVILDGVAGLRKEMVRDCIHPYEHLVPHDDRTVTCKFCNKRFTLTSDNNGSTEA